ncbi:hypothetical protein INR49_001943 [Caranx melampygus]|nr:hypothetical protein INR49_001943 [Caranx melampygus]
MLPPPLTCICCSVCVQQRGRRAAATGLCRGTSLLHLRPSPPLSPVRTPTMGFAGLGSAVLFLASLLSLVGVSSAGSDAPRGVAVGFVFDPRAKCEPPCQHAGICIRNNTCFCSRGYEGETCQYVTCDAGCWNGGECIAVNGVAKCICPSSWTGSRCQEGLFIATSNYPADPRAICPQGCRNGGICVAPGICSCPEGWLGGACHTAVCSKPCLNGGKCISPDKCRCRPPYSGPHCEERKKSH